MKLSLNLKPENPVGWVILAILARLALSMLFSALLVDRHGSEEFVFDFIYIHNDFGYFLHPVEKYFETGTLSYDGRSAFAGRMPGYSFPYLLLRFIFDKPLALLSLILMQITLSGIAVYALAKLANDWFQSKRAFYFVFIVALFSPLLSVFDFQTITESFSISCFVLHIFFLHKGFEKKLNKYFLLSGYFIAWAVFLRPFLGIALFISGLVLLIEWRKSTLKFTQLLLFAAPFILFESAWIVRNYNATGKFIPLESGLASYGKLYSPGYQKLRELLYRMGEETAYVDPGMARWMRRSSEPFQSKKDYDEKTIPSRSALVEIRSMYQASKMMDGAEYEKADRELIVRVQIELDVLREESLVRYYFAGPANGMKKLWLHSGSSYLPFPPFQEMSLLQKAIKLFSSAVYFIILFLGIYALFRLKLKHSFKLYFLCFPVLLSLSLVWVSTIQEARYVIAVFPILVLLTAGLLTNFRKDNHTGNDIGNS